MVLLAHLLIYFVCGDTGFYPTSDCLIDSHDTMVGNSVGAAVRIVGIVSGHYDFCCGSAIADYGQTI